MLSHLEVLPLLLRYVCTLLNGDFNAHASFPSIQVSDVVFLKTGHVFQGQENTLKAGLLSPGSTLISITGDPQIVRILCSQGIVLLQKSYYSGTDLVLKLPFMTFGFPKSPFYNISGLHLMKNYEFFPLLIPHFNNLTMVDQF